MVSLDWVIYDLEPFTLSAWSLGHHAYRWTVPELRSPCMQVDCSGA